MMAAAPFTIDLQEYKPVSVEASRLSPEAAELLWRRYRAHVDVEPPSFKTENRWILTSRGWVGHIPLTADLHLRLLPKVTLSNLFRMLEVAYQVDIRIGDGLTSCDSLEELFQRLANVLARRVLDRACRGFYRTYRPVQDNLPYVRGRLAVEQMIRDPVKILLSCRYEEHTTDVEENQLLAWTLFRIARTALCTGHTLRAVRRAYRSLLGVAELVPFSPQACTGRVYNRLNDDYHPMHALCRFFLEYSGPTHSSGDRTMLPFLIDMNRLFELFVAEWLKRHLPPSLRVVAQDTVELRGRQATDLSFRIDLVISEAETGHVRCVLDTKYKAAPSPKAEDVSQVVAYAVAKGCTEAVLVYPVGLSAPLDARVGGVRVRSVPFLLDGDIDESGVSFLRQLLTSETS